MRLNLFVVGIFLFFCVSPSIKCEAQVDSLLRIKDSITVYRDTVVKLINKDRDDEMFYSQDAYNKYFEKYFTLLNYNKETFTDGNSAELKISDKETKLNLTLSKKVKNYILSLGTGLNISDNSGTLFSNSKPTAGTQFFINNSILLTGQTSLRFDEDLRENNYSERLNVIDSFYVEHALKIPNRAAIFIKEYDSLTLIMNSLPKVIDDALLKTRIGNPSDTIKKYTAILKKNQAVLIKSISAREKISKDVENIRIKKPVEDIVQDLKNKAKAISVSKELKTEGVTVFQLKWVSFGISYQRDEYKTYDSALMFSKRLDTKPFDGLGATFAFNYYWQRNEAWIDFLNARGLNSVYFNLNYSVNASNNFASLKEANLSIIKTQIKNDTIYQFSTQERLRDITGKDFERFWKHKIGFQLTGMFGKKQFIGINLSSNVEISKKEDPTLNSRLGTLFRFVDSANQKSKVNFEVFFAFDDLTNSKDSEKSVWQRKSIGISASLPFQKVFFN